MIFSRAGRSPRARLDGADGAAGHVGQARGRRPRSRRSRCVCRPGSMPRMRPFMAAGWKYQRTEWKNTGAAKHSGATRSSRPTAPVTELLVAPVAHAGVLLQRLHHELAQRAAGAGDQRPSPAPASGLKGVIQNSSAPDQRGGQRAGQPGAVREASGRCARATGRRRSQRLASSCTICAPAATIDQEEQQEGAAPGVAAASPAAAAPAHGSGRRRRP